MPWFGSMLLIFMTLVILVVIGMPVGFAVGLVGVIGVFFVSGFSTLLGDIPLLYVSNLTIYSLIAIPLFVLLVEFAAEGGISQKLCDVSIKIMGRLPGGLAVACTVAGAVFGAISGASSVASIVVADMFLPEAMNRNYDKSFIIGTIAAAGTLSLIIPPSFVLIVFGIVAGVSIGDLFMATVIPGIICTTLFVIFIAFRAARNPYLAPVPPPVPWKEKIRAVGRGWEIALLIFIILGGVYWGVTTVTEVAAVGCLGALIITVAYRRLTLSKASAALKKSSEICGFFFMLFIGAFFFQHLLIYLQIPQHITTWVAELNLSSLETVLAMQILCFALGTFMDTSALLLIMVPLFLPSLKAQGVDLVWLGVSLNMVAMMASICPPMGINNLVLQNQGKPYGITLGQILRGSWPFMFLILITLVLTMAWHPLATWLPGIIK